MDEEYDTLEYATVYGSTMQIANEAKVREWYQVIEGGVPEDVALVWLENEATAVDARKQYRDSWNIARREVKSASGGLTEAECIAIRIYTMERFKFYKKFNKDCRKDKWTPYKVLTSLLHTGLSKLRTDPSSYSAALYRGVSCVSLNETEGEFFMPGFTSTSESRSKAKQFGDRIVKFVSSRAARVQQFSAYSYEQEALFSPFQCFVCRMDKTKAKPVAIVETCAVKTLPFQTFPVFRGALLGALVGNCIGSPFEFQETTTMTKLIESLSYLEKNKESRGICRYTADTCMTFAVAGSLTKVGRCDISDLMNSLAKAFLADPSRDYGENIANVLLELNELTPIGDPFAPAKRLFGGSGSHGNGGATRITPIALFFWNSKESDFNEKVKDSTRLTHNNESGMNGAVLQATAIQLALEFSVYIRTKQDIDVRQRYLERLQERMQSIESRSGNCPYCSKLRRIKSYLESPPTTETIILELGTETTAYNSVPTAIYCFLRGMQPIPGIPEERTDYERTVIYAISLGGDTDTIASMAGAIAGAYYGQDSIPQRWRDICEAKAIEDAKRYAKDIHNLVWK